MSEAKAHVDQMLARAAKYHHTLDDKDITALRELIGELSAQIGVVKWVHIDDALPPIGDWVLVGGHRKDGSWWNCAERARRNGGGWEWENNEDEPAFKTLEYWADVCEPPPTRRIAPPPAPILSQEEISALTRDPDPNPSARQT